MVWAAHQSLTRMSGPEKPNQNLSFGSLHSIGLRLQSDLSGLCADVTSLSGAVQRAQGRLHICSPGKPRFPAARLPQPSSLERREKLVNKPCWRWRNRLKDSLKSLSPSLWQRRIHSIGPRKKACGLRKPSATHVSDLKIVLARKSKRRHESYAYPSPAEKITLVAAS